MNPVVLKQLVLTDSADTELRVRWVDDDNQPFALTSGVLQVRSSEDATGAPLLNVAAVIVDPWAVFVCSAADVVAAGFESLPGQAVWEAVLTRTDGRKLSAAGGPVLWSRGVVR